jgi:hypothetical protein
LELQLFSDQLGRDLRWTIFMKTDLGKLHQCFPFEELTKLFPGTSGIGRPPIMDIKGGIALQVLKAYLNLSDAKLVARLNSDWVLQYFCGIRLGPGQWIKDKDLVGRWRRYLARHINYETFQHKLAEHWKPHMNNTQAVLMDATCYESHLRYPTDVKLLWECCQWLWAVIDVHYKAKGLSKPRRKEKQQRTAFLNYQKRRRKTHKLERKRRRSLLLFLEKGLKKWDDLVFKYGVLLSQKDHERLQTIRLVYQQQQARFDDPDYQIKNRIVSLHKDYIRPIVRGKETKRTEFGAKVHCFQVDGISFVEHLSFEAFNESTRLKSTVSLHRKYFGQTRQLGADRIYATNANRRFCAIKGMATSFVRKGPKPKQPTPRDEMRKILAAARASAMEGAFGNEKLHYGLQKVKAKTEATETLWIYFGIWTASAQKIAKRLARSQPDSLAA